MSLNFFGHPRFEEKAGGTALQKDVKAAVTLDGRFGFVIQREGGTSMFCSADGITQLFYAVKDGAMHHGTTVSEVVESAGLEWRWNYEALAELAVLGHLVSDHTIHPEVRRVGAAELVTWDGSVLTRQKLEYPPQVPGDPVNRAIDALLEAVRAEGSAGDVVSLSAGFDSRLILAAFLALGVKPNLAVMGAAQSTDVVTATEIARRFHLQLDWVPLEGDRLVSDRSSIARRTSGSKLLDSWHTHEYISAARQPDGTGIWFGSNGEYARTFFFDRGVQFYLANALGAPVVRMFWAEMVRRGAIPDSLLPFLAPELRECLRPERLVAHLMSAFPRGSLGELNDQLYRERVRQFIANGLRLVSARYSPRTPFLHPRWIEAAERLPRSWKLGNRWHRYAIRRLCPQLLSLPYDATSRPMGRRPGPWYWLGFESHARTVPFFDYANFVSTPGFRRAYQAAVASLKGIADGDDTSVLLKPLPLKSTVYFGTLGFFAETQAPAGGTSRGDPEQRAILGG